MTGGSDLKCSGWISVPKLASAGRQSWSGHQLKGLASLHLREVEKAMTTLLDALVNWKQSQISYNVSCVCYLGIWLGVQNITKASVVSKKNRYNSLLVSPNLKGWILNSSVALQISQDNPPSTVFWSWLQQCPQSIFPCNYCRFPHVPNLHMIAEVSIQLTFPVLNCFSSLGKPILAHTEFEMETTAPIVCLPSGLFMYLPIPKILSLGAELVNAIQTLWPCRLSLGSPSLCRHFCLQVPLCYLGHRFSG